MSDPVSASPEDLVRQARQYLESLRAAGVEWLPAAHTAPLPARLPQAAPANVTAPTLFAETAEPAAAGPVPGEAPLEQRRQALELLAEQVSTCSRCSELFCSRTQTVFGHGPLSPELCFIGEA